MDLLFSDLLRRLPLIAFALILQPAWFLPSNGNFLLTSIQHALIPAGLLLACLTLLTQPRSLSVRTLSKAEIAWFCFLGIGIAGSLLSPAPLARLSGILSWVEASLIILLLSRVVPGRSVTELSRLFTRFAGVAALIYLIAESIGLKSWPAQIYPNHLALLLILPCCFAAADLWKAKIVASLRPALLFLVIAVALFFSKSRAVLLALALIATTAFILEAFRRLRTQQTPWLLIKGSTFVFFLLAAFLISEGLLSTTAEGSGLGTTAATLAYSEEGSIGGRFRRWQNAVPLIQSSPWFGHGLGSWYSSFDAYRHSVVPDAAGLSSAVSTYVLLASEVGFFGLLCFAGFVCLMLFRRANPGGSTYQFALAAWLIALAFHSASDFNLVLAGFAVPVGLAIRSQTTHGDPPAAFAPRRLLIVLIGFVLTATILHGKVSLAWLESNAISMISRSAPISSDRLLWRNVSKLSNVIGRPFTMQNLLRDAEGLQSSLSLHPSGRRDSHLFFADYFEKHNDSAEAIRWYQQAVSREPTNRVGLLGLCRNYASVNEPSKATEYCARVLSTNSREHTAHTLLAGIAEAQGHDRAAHLHMTQARDELWSRLDVNDFGNGTLKVVSRRYAEYRRVSEGLMRLSSKLEPVTAATSATLRQIPTIHSRIAQSGCAIYLTANINARHNLWRVDTCSPKRPMRIISNGSLSPFQPHATDDGVFFVSDNRGNGKYRLFFRHLNEEVTRKLSLPAGHLHTYKVHSDQKMLAVVLRHKGIYSLYAANVGERLELLYQSESVLDHLDWHPRDQSMLLVEGQHAVLLADRMSGVVSELLKSEESRFGAPRFSAIGKTFVVAKRSAIAAAQVLTHDLSEGDTQVVFSSSKSYAVDPMWLSDDTLLFREVINDEYRLRKLSVRDGSVEAVGPEGGVVYPVSLDRERETAWFLTSSELRPMYLASLNTRTAELKAEKRFAWVRQSEALPTQTARLEPHNANVYRIDPRSGPGEDIIVWLHGSGSAYSPRWHTIAQQFANEGYAFVALNYETRWSVDPVQGPKDWSEGIKQLSALVAELRSQKNARIHLLGVSQGTRLLHQYLSDPDTPSVESAIEFSPVDDALWEEMRDLPPMLLIAGARDPLFNAKKWNAQVSKNSEPNDHVTLRLLEGEGHDLRGRNALNLRMEAALDFLAR